MEIKEIAKNKPYPGRFLILGKRNEEIIAVYGVTARNISSRAKRYVFSEDKKSIIVEATDAEIMAQGDLSLLDYSAVHFFETGLIIGNGRQTDRVHSLTKNNAEEQLNEDLKDETFEIDKYNTPRITGCILEKNGNWTCALHIIRSNDYQEPVRDCYALDTVQENALFISTYDGPNVRPTPSFVGKPIPLKLPSGDCKKIATYIYAAFEPKNDEEDVRVSVIVISTNQLSCERKTYIINRNETI